MKGFINDIWWMLLLRGITLLLFGFTAVVWPGLTFVSLAIFFSAYVLVSGMADILIAIGAASHKRAWFITFLLGVIEVGVGTYLLKYPGLALATFIAVAGFTFILQGIFAIIASFIDTQDPGMKILEIASGILGIIAGFIVLQNPVSGGIAFTWVLGVYGIIAGTLSIASALSLRHMTEEVRKVLSPHRAVVRN